MSLRLKIVAIFNKNMKYLQRLNWPELSRYCGCCPLSVGISIRCFLSLVRIMAIVTYSVYILTRVFNTKWALHSVSIILVSQEENITLTDDDLLFIHDTMISLIVYEIMWITLKFLHVWAVLATMFSICCKKPRLLQVAFYIILPNWMLDILNMVSSKFFLNPVFQVIFLVDICYDGYNLLAINSLYKQMSRKSRIVPGDDLNNQDNSPETPTTTVTPFAETTLYQCVTCYNSVPLEHRSDVVNIPQVNIPIETPEDTNNDAADNTQENNEEKILNFKDGPIIFNQEQLEGEHS